MIITVALFVHCFILIHGHISGDRENTDDIVKCIFLKPESALLSSPDNNRLLPANEMLKIKD